MIEKNGVKMKQFYGMSSATAMQKHAGGVAEYRYLYFYFYFGQVYVFVSGIYHSVLVFVIWNICIPVQLFVSGTMVYWLFGVDIRIW